MSEENITDDDSNEVLVELEEESGGTEAQAPAAEAAAGDDDSDELSSYSAKVQSRIKRLTEKYRKEERDREEATRIAQKLLEENQQLKSRVQALDTGYLAEYGARLENQEQIVKNAYRTAYESGDAEAMLAAQEDLARIVLEKQRYATAKQRAEAPQTQPVERPVQTTAAPQAPAPVRPDPKAQSWAEKNKWFGEDRVMTTAALAIHQTLVEDEGFDPNSNEYYTEIDRRLRTEFPQKFAARKPGGGSQVAPAGNSASRSTAQERRTVRLTPSQVAIAKRLNVPLEEYAKYVKD
jgi:hypothetical protein